MGPLVRVARCLVALAMSSAALGADSIKIGVLKFGTVNWELDALKHHGLDEANGVDVEVVGLASKNATSAMPVQVSYTSAGSVAPRRSSTWHVVA